MGGFQSKEKVQEDTYRFWSAVASSLRLGWLGTDDASQEMKVCQLALFPLLLNACAAREDIEGLERHLTEGADVSAADAHGRTALHLAALGGSVETVRFLLEKGADVNIKDGRKDTALRDAIRSKNLEVISMLLSEGATIDTFSENLGAEMCCLAHEGNSEMMEVWKHAGVDLNVADEEGRTPLHVAVCTNQVEMVKFCISNGSHVEQEDRLGSRPVDDAQRLGLQHLVELLNSDRTGQWESLQQPRAEQQVLIAMDNMDLSA